MGEYGCSHFFHAVLVLISQQGNALVVLAVLELLFYGEVVLQQVLYYGLHVSPDTASVPG